MKISFSILTCIFMSFVAIAQLPKGQSAHSSFSLGIVDHIQSRILSEERTLNIYLPDGYFADTVLAYPVIYLLDGSYNEDFVHITGIVQFLTMIGYMPETIIVGIANVDRKRDFTFPTSVAADKKQTPQSGGSAKFIDFIEMELQPHVKSHYRVNNNSTLIGQSLGGLLATELLLKKTNLFGSYILVSPSLWWNDESLLASIPSGQNLDADHPSRVIVSVGAEGDQMEHDAKKFAEILEQKKVNVTFMPMAEETHLTILHNCIYKALVMVNKK